MKALITGVGGFVGSYLVKHLVGRGFTVFGFDRKGSEVEGCSVFRCDVTDYDAVSGIVKNVRPAFVFHLAGQSSVTDSWDKPGLTARVNVGGFRNVLDAVVAADLNPEVLLVSSAEVYGIPELLPLRESHPLRPSSPYGKSKVTQEEIALDFVKRKGLRVVIARSFNHTGPGQSDKFVCSSFARQFAGFDRGESASIKAGDVSIKRDFCDVRDVVRAYLLLIQKGRAGEAYNVCSGRSFSIGDIIGMFAGLSGVDVKLVEEKSRMRHAAIPDLQGDNSKIKAEVGWKPEIGFDETLSSLLEYWRGK